MLVLDGGITVNKYILHMYISATSCRDCIPCCNQCHRDLYRVC